MEEVDGFPAQNENEGVSELPHLCCGFRVVLLGVEGYGFGGFGVLLLGSKQSTSPLKIKPQTPNLHKLIQIINSLQGACTKRHFARQLAASRTKRRTQK